MRNTIIIISLLFTAGLIAQTPASSQDGPIMLRGATAHLGNGEVIENAVIAFDNGKLTVVTDGSRPVDARGHEVIDLSGKHVYPGFILPNTSLGLQEVSSIRAMSDNSERGGLNPNVRALISYNTDSEFIPTFRFNGILIAESTPSGGLISGTSSVMELEGWNWEDAVHTADAGMHMNWPSRVRSQFNFATFSRTEQPNDRYEKDIAELSGHFKDAVNYAANKTSRNLKMEAMQGLFDGSQTLFIHVSNPKTIVESVKFAQDHGVQHIALVTGSDALMVAEFLKDNKIPVVLPPTHSMPRGNDQDIHMPYKLPHLLTEAGVTVCLSHSGMLSNARNLPFYAGTAAAWGMNKEDALKTITSNPARILRIDDRVGTLEVGKDATLFVSEGDVMDMRTSIITHVFIGGKTISLTAKQQELHERFSKKYGDME